MMRNREIGKYWKKVMPDSEPRISQVETFDWFKSLSPETKYLLLEMPVGGGKSPIGLTLSSWLSNTGMGNSFILTPQKILQKQYEDSFDDHILASMYGKSNYKCHPKNTDCEVGSMTKPSCGFSCPHRQAFISAIKNPNMVLNYKLALLYFQFVLADDDDPKSLKPRELMVLDECHNLEKFLIDHTGVSISEDHMKKMELPISFHKPTSLFDALRWIKEEYHKALSSYIINLSKIVEEMEIAGILNSEYQKYARKLVSGIRHFDSVNTLIMASTLDDIIPGEEFIYIPGDKQSFMIREVFAKRAFNRIVLPAADKFLFMSSTILNKEQFCYDLGIDHKKAEFLSLKSEFDPEHRKTFFMGAAKMTYGWDKPDRIDESRLMLDAISIILENHEDESGIIHTSSYKISKWITDELDLVTNHHIINHNPSDDKKNGEVIKRDDAIAAYIESTKVRPTILISPSITEGLDLRDDLARFAIFAKVPFASLGDAWVKRRMRISNEWYMRQALIEIIQGSGRICRSTEDWGTTYILDSSFKRLYNTMDKTNSVPGWWKEGLEIE